MDNCIFLVPFHWTERILEVVSNSHFSYMVKAWVALGVERASGCTSIWLNAYLSNLRSCMGVGCNICLWFYVYPSSSKSCQNMIQYQSSIEGTREVANPTWLSVELGKYYMIIKVGSISTTFGYQVILQEWKLTFKLPNVSYIFASMLGQAHSLMVRSCDTVPM